MISALLLAHLIIAANAAPSNPILTRFSGKIVGGEAADIKEVPYQAALLMDFSGSYSLTCGGSLITTKAVISAGHCQHGTVAKVWKIRIGSSSYSEGGDVIEVEKLKMHPRYNSYEIDYDISLYFLKEAAVLSSSVALIPLAKQGQIIADDSTALASGWGTTGEGGDLPDTLQKVELKIVSQDACKEAYGDVNMEVTDRMICAGVDEGGKDACQGDSGGPLVVDGELVGITSWGLGCARKGFPGVWARIPALRSWVDHQLPKPTIIV